LGYSGQTESMHGGETVNSNAGQAEQLDTRRYGAAMNSTDGPDREAGPAEPMTIGAGFDFSDPSSPLAPFYLRGSAVAAVTLLALVFVLLCYVPLWHTDVWGHLKFGQWIVVNRMLPERDSSCPFTEEAPAGVNHGWLSQVVLALVFQAGESLVGADGQRLAGGVDALRLLHALTVTLRCALLLIAFRRVSGSLPCAGAALSVMLILSVGNIAVLRPQVFGELFFAALMVALSRPTLSARTLVMVPLLFVVWANVHGSFATGLVLLAASLAGQAIEVAWNAPTGKLAALVQDVPLRRLTVLLAASALAACVNPSGPALFADVVNLANHPNVRAQDEWRPLPFTSPAGGHWAYLIIVVLFVATLVCCQRKFTPRALVLIVVFGSQPLLHQRMLIWWLMVAPWIMAACWPTCNLRLVTRWSGWETVPSFRKTLIAAAIVVVACLWSIPTQWLLAGRPTPLERSVSGGTPWQLTRLLNDPAQAPAADLQPLAADLHKYYPDGLTGCVFASETLGDFLLWDLPPRNPVFIYTHVHLFSEDHWRQCMDVRGAKPGWRDILNRNRVNLIVVEPDRNPRLGALLREDMNWHVVLDETNSTAKRDPRNRLFVAIRIAGK
jgi:hypothetical protein